MTMEMILSNLEKLNKMNEDIYANYSKIQAIYKQLRKKEHLSQAVFAAVLNISTSTIQKWETGEKKPSGPSLKLLSILKNKGIEALI